MEGAEENEANEVKEANEAKTAREAIRTNPPVSQELKSPTDVFGPSGESAGSCVSPHRPPPKTERRASPRGVSAMA